MKKMYKGLVSHGVLSAVHAVTEATSSSEAIQKIKAAGHRFSYAETVSEVSELRGYVKDKVNSGDYIWVGDRPQWW